MECCCLHLSPCADKKSLPCRMTPIAASEPLPASDGSPEFMRLDAHSRWWASARRSIAIFFLFWAVYFAVHWLRPDPDRITFIDFWISRRPAIELAAYRRRVSLAFRPDMYDSRPGILPVQIYSWAPGANLRPEPKWFAGKIMPSLGGKFPWVPVAVACPPWFAVSLSLGIALGVWPWRVRRRTVVASPISRRAPCGG